MKHNNGRCRAPRQLKKMTINDKERSEKELQKLIKENDYKDTGK